MGDEELEPHEVFWRDLHPFLMAHGYQLRPRFRPGWIPSWKGKGKSSMYFEDSNALLVRRDPFELFAYVDRDLVPKSYRRGQAGGRQRRLHKAC